MILLERECKIWVRRKVKFFYRRERYDLKIFLKIKVFFTLEKYSNVFKYGVFYVADSVLKESWVCQAFPPTPCFHLSEGQTSSVTESEAFYWWITYIGLSKVDSSYFSEYRRVRMGILGFSVFTSLLLLCERGLLHPALQDLDSGEGVWSGSSISSSEGSSPGQCPGSDGPGAAPDWGSVTKT